MYTEKMGEVCDKIYEMLNEFEPFDTLPIIFTILDYQAARLEMRTEELIEQVLPVIKEVNTIMPLTDSGEGGIYLEI